MLGNMPPEKLVPQQEGRRIIDNMAEEIDIRELVESDILREGNLKESELVERLYATAGTKLNAMQSRAFVALTQVLGLTKDNRLIPTLKQAYLNASIIPPHWGGNIEIGLPEFVDGMRELSVDDDEISNHIVNTLEYRVVEGMNYGGILECVAIPFVKAEPVKTKVKTKLHQLQRESTSVRSNPNATYESWEKSRAKIIEELFRNHQDALYEAARLEEEMETTFDYMGVLNWRRKARDESDRFKPPVMRPERLSDDGEEGRYKKLLIQHENLMQQIPAYEARSRAIELAQLDIVLDSDVVTGAAGKVAEYALDFYRIMYKLAEALGKPQAYLEGLKATAKERYGEKARL